jgi:uncharacterized membrane protein YjjP (DUF1212 family)/uncharacterized membrane protein YjjB (DUF3815 family)
MDDLDFNKACDFIVKLGATALGYGASSFRLESHLNRVTAALGLRGDFAVTPEKIESVLWREGDERQRVNVTGIADTSLNMAGLARVDELVGRVESGEVSVEAGIARLGEIRKTPARFGPLMTAVSFGLIGAGFGVRLSLPWHDVIIGVVLSQVVYAVVFVLGRSPTMARMIKPLAAFVAAILAYAIAATWAPSSKHVMVTLCAIIALIANPGLILGPGELSSNHIASGTARLISAIVVLTELAFGAFVGTAIASAVWTIPAGSAVASMGPGWAWVAIVVLGAGLAMLFQVRPTEFGWVILGCVLAFAGTVVAGKLLGSGPGDLLGALVLGIFANGYALRTRRPASSILLTGLIVLAPGYASYLALGTLQTVGVEAGLLDEFKVFVSIAWILGGLFIANTIIPPTRTVQPPPGS